MLSIVAVVAGLLLLPYVLGPVLVFVGQRAPIRPPTFEYPICERLPEMPDEARAFLDRAGRELSTIGFEPRAILSLEPAASVRTFLLYAVERRGGGTDKAIAVAALVTGGGGAPRLHSTYFEFQSRAADGDVLLVNNSAVSGSFPETEGITVLRVTEAKDAATLRRIHVGLGRKLGIRAKRPAPDPATPTAAIHESIAREMERACSRGYMYADREAGVFRPTPKGAALMTWKQLPPWSYALESSRRADVERALLEIGETV